MVAKWPFAMMGGAVGVRPSPDGRSDIVVAIALWGGGVVGTDRREVELVAKASGRSGNEEVGEREGSYKRSTAAPDQPNWESGQVRTITRPLHERRDRMIPRSIVRLLVTGGE